MELDILIITFIFAYYILICCFPDNFHNNYNERILYIIDDDIDVDMIDDEDDDMLYDFDD